MASGDNILEKIQELFGEFGGTLNILEEQIDIDIQTEYFEYSQNFDKDFNPDDVIKNKENIFRKHTSIEEKKNMLVQLASIDSVEAFRTIERYIKDPNQKLHDWAKLALQESKLLLESKFLDENQVLITTGLGGKGLKLRYFIALLAKNSMPLSKLHQKVIKSELEYSFKNCHAEIEKISFDEDLCLILSIIPIQFSIQKLFDHIIDECNQFGDFLYKNYLITNVKILTIDEIREFISLHYNQLK